MLDYSKIFIAETIRILKTREVNDGIAFHLIIIRENIEFLIHFFLVLGNLLELIILIELTKMRTIKPNRPSKNLFSFLSSFKLEYCLKVIKNFISANNLNFAFQNKD